NRSARFAARLRTSHNDCSVARNPPNARFFDWRSSHTAIFPILAGPFQPPRAVGRRCDQRFRRDIQPQIRPEIDDNEPRSLTQPPQQKALLAEHGSFDRPFPNPPPQFQKVLMHAPNRLASLALAPVQLATFECLLRARIRSIGLLQAGKLRKKLLSTLPH